MRAVECVASATRGVTCLATTSAGRPSLLAISATPSLPASLSSSATSSAAAASTTEAEEAAAEDNNSDEDDDSDDTGEALAAAQTRLLSELQTIADYYLQLRSVDRANATVCLEMHLAFLRGPKNRPTADRHGLLRVAEEFLQSLMRAPACAASPVGETPSCPKSSCR